MIVVQLSDPRLRRAVCRAAHEDEDVIADARQAPLAIEWGYPRLIVHDREHRRILADNDSRALEIDDDTLRRWEAERLSKELPSAWMSFVTGRLSLLMDRSCTEPNWAGRTVADLERATGQRLPFGLKSVGRRILEFPYQYSTLHPIADQCCLSRGALKARFRRRGLSSPSTYLRWFRTMAVGHLLSDQSVTVAECAHRLGFSSAGNLCRMLSSVSGLTPSEVRTLSGRNGLLIDFAFQHLSTDALDAWASLDNVFKRRVA